MLNFNPTGAGSTLGQGIPNAPSTTAVNNKVAPTLPTPPPVVQPPNPIVPQGLKTMAPTPQAPQPAPVKSGFDTQGLLDNFSMGVPQAAAQSTPPPSTTSPKISNDMFQTMRNTMDDSTIMHNIYNADPAFKAKVDMMKPFYNSQSPDWQSRFPTFALNKYYNVGVNLPKDPSTNALLSGITSPDAATAPWFSNEKFGSGDMNPIDNALGMAGNFLQEAGNTIAHPIKTAQGVISSTIGAGELAGRAAIKGIDAISGAGTMDLLKKIVAAHPDEQGPVASALRALTSTTPDQAGLLDTLKTYGITPKGISIADPTDPTKQTLVKGLFEHPLLPSLMIGGGLSKLNDATGAVDKAMAPVDNTVSSVVQGAKNIAGKITGKAATPQFSPQTSLLAEYYGTTPQKITSSIKNAGLDTADGVQPIEDHLSKTFGKDHAGFGDFVDQKLGDSATPADYNAAENARIDATKMPDQTQAFQRAVQPKMSAADTKKLLESNPKLVQEGMNKTGILKGSPGSSFTKDDASLAEVAKTIPDFKPVANSNKHLSMKEAVDNTVAVHDAITNESNALRQQMIKAGDGAMNPIETQSRISTALEGMKKYFRGDSAKIDDVKTLAQEISQDHKGTWSGQWEARQEFYKQAELKWGKNIWDKGNTYSQAVKTVGQEWNGAIHDAASPAGIDFQPQMERLSSMYDIRGNLTSHVTNDIYNSKLKNLLKNNAAARILTKAAANTVGLGAAHEILSH